MSARERITEVPALTLMGTSATAATEEEFREGPSNSHED